jgi:ribosomal protein S18 acetylase RimI-like enzyme
MFRDEDLRVAVNKLDLELGGLRRYPKPRMGSIGKLSSPVVAARSAANPITCRPAVFADSGRIARLICVAGGGLYEFLLGDLIPFVHPANFLTIATASAGYAISYRNCLVAIDATLDAVIGMANVFPTDLLKQESLVMLPFNRRNHIRALVELHDWGSMFVNALAVSELYRRCGIGGQLLDWAEDRAKQEGFDRLSLHVWADNTTALNFYKARGFIQLAVGNIPYHSRLRHVGGSILMQKKIGSASHCLLTDWRPTA